MHVLNEGEAAQSGDTQLLTIRDLMLTASGRGVWLTLEEIAEFTAAGEASISAQLRHLRKARYGRYHVEKRRRESSRNSEIHARGNPAFVTSVWEYRVLASGAGTTGRAAEAR